MQLNDRVLSVSVIADGRRLDLEGYDMYLDSVDLTNSRDPNTAKVIIYNLGTGNRGIISGEHQAITISAASVVSPTATKIFAGQTTFIKHVPPTKANPRWETYIEARDGVKTYRDSWVSSSWVSGTPLTVVVGEIAAEMGIPVDCRVSGSLRGPWAYNGRAVDALSELSWDYAARWVIYQGTLEFLDATASIDRNTTLAVDVSKDSGMIGTPVIVEREPKGGKRRFGVTGKMILHPAIRPNGLVRIVSTVSAGGGVARDKKGRVYKTPGANGVFRVQRATHYGSRITPEFYTDFETESFSV